jgi:CRP-like cAMP-binding protein
VGRSISHRLVASLRQVPDFAGLDEAVLLQVVGASADLLWRQGETIFSPGEPADALYVIRYGRVRIADDGDGADGRDVAELGPGEYFGEQALLLHTTHTRRAEAVEDCELMVVSRAGFEQLLDAEPAVADEFRETLERRIRAQESPT